MFSRKQQDNPTEKKRENKRNEVKVESQNVLYKAAGYINAWEKITGNIRTKNPRKRRKK